ncbi:GH36-type glycosyl hydrolase domain-containing protein [Luteimonas sp. 22616]|uniref:GH36-type glycosyl hydrolase domain-containing protein n=1 Tax=Luteimonas sp. 22616 TaxID=3453951 RepID=UPI003F85685F
MQLLSNGHHTVMLTASGAGYSQWRDCAITRWRADPTCDDRGCWLYLRDVDGGATWSAGLQPVGGTPDDHAVEFDADRVCIRRRDGDIETTTEVLVAGDADADVRRITLRNDGDRERTVELTTYAELVLAPSQGDAAHPAFSKMFVRTEWLAERQLLLATRRVRSPGDPSACAAQWLDVESGTSDGPQWETDRARIIGRGGNQRMPAALATPELPGTVGTVLDPVFCLRRRVRLAPGGSATLQLWTVAAESREEVLAVADRFRDAGAFARASQSASRHSQARLAGFGIDDAQAQRFQRLASALLYADPPLRAAPDLLAAGQGGAPTLWAGGISGDRPIVLLRIEDDAGLALVDELLRASAYWQAHGVDADLVVLAEAADDEAAAFQASLQACLDAHAKRFPPEDGKPNLFALRADQATPALQAGLATAAAIVLDQRDGPLAVQVDALPAGADATDSAAVVAASVGSRPTHGEPDNAIKSTIEGSLEFFNGHGGFAENGREYVTIIRNGVLPPMPWLNVVANPDFGFTATEAGGGYAWSQNSQRNPITPWANDPVSDPPQEVLYVRDEDDRRLFTATALPRCGDDGEYVARHGHGYSRFQHAEHGIELDLLQYVPVDDGLKISRLRLRNRSGRTRTLSVTAFVQWALGPNGTRPAPFIATTMDTDTGALFASNAWRAEFGERVAFIDLRGRQASHGGDRLDFIGRHGDLASPAALRTGAPLSGRTGAGLDPCGALQARIELPADGEDEVVLLLGDAADADAARELVRRYRDADLDAVLQAATQQWNDILGTVQVRTPDRAMDLLLNGWLLYQALCCRVWARTAYYQASGAYGFRDQLQDVMATCIARPDETRAQLLRAAGRQFEEGDVQHWWLPPGGDGIRTRMTDDRLWLPFVACHYMNTTGDTAVLDTRQPFIEGPQVEPGAHEAYYRPTTADTDASLYEHCARAIDISLTLGAHDLPLFGTGDWNDGMNRVGEQGRGESSWLGWFLCATIDAFAPYAKARGEPERAARWEQVAETVRKGLDAGGWDGQWYRRGYYDDGTPLGSHESQECRIDAIAQSWSVIAGGGDPEHAASAMEQVERQLILRDEKLALLFTPPLQHTEHDPGYIKAYPSGLRENGGQYTHGSQWSIFAFSKLGDGDRAFDLFSLINPIHHASTREGVARYKVEPYVAAADVYSVEPHVGRGGWTWYTGSGAWLYRAGLEAILSFHLQGDHLRLDPCIPGSWPGFSIDYRHGGSRYLIEVANPHGVCRGIARCELDGRALDVDPCVIPLQDDGAVHHVVVELGG